jgi:MoaA/NifB/PqqE/SkfB family radical SAM enzyme
MEIIRRIGQHDVLIDTSEPCGISLEEATVAPTPGEDVILLEKATILGMLSSGNDYLPLSLHWELLDKCNFACPFCYIVGHSFNRIVRFSEIRNHLSDLIHEGLLFCTLTGGEVTIHPDFKSIYAFLKENGVIVEVFTNGYAIDDEIVELFRSHPPSSVEVSLYSLDNSRLRNCYGVKDSLGASKVLDNVLRMKRAGIHVVCKTFLNTVTSSDIESAASWCKSNEIDHYSSFDITQAYDGTDLRTYQVRKNEPQALLRKSPPTAVCLPCKTKNYGSAINASFSIFPCPAIRLSDCTYDLRQIGVKESLRRMKAFMRCFQDTQIQGSESGSSNCASCMAFAKPVRNEAGELMHFGQP